MTFIFSTFFWSLTGIKILSLFFGCVFVFVEILDGLPERRTRYRAQKRAWEKKNTPS